jgi:hypothetical protein
MVRRINGVRFEQAGRRAGHEPPHESRADDEMPAERRKIGAAFASGRRCALAGESVVGDVAPAKTPVQLPPIQVARRREIRGAP